MGEAKRRKKLDPNWGKPQEFSYKDARLAFNVKHTVADLPQKLSAAFIEQANQLTDSQQIELLRLTEDFNASTSNLPQENQDQWFEDFLESAKSRVDPEVFEIFLGYVLALLQLRARNAVTSKQP